ncbi:hypothetical protein [Cohnella cholangitidis]|uniref:Uncharacterized protein n=1 Tax=Cohnella cholangitidis TaxID=2598458 RepID=A0A7G5BXC3_9BACL|nr:hypothetical protein [Cohnella cholangitidis]QMV41607.1 hypothetical protein FPL14_10745 [Cohnella cholangitidis]
MYVTLPVTVVASISALLSSVVPPSLLQPVTYIHHSPLRLEHLPDGYSATTSLVALMVPFVPGA